MLVKNAYDTAAKIIEENSDALVRIAETLLEREVLDGTEVLQLIRGENLPAMPPKGGKDSEDHTQQVLRPEGGRRAPGFSEGERPQPA
jgi:cell division protease FtsH